METAIAYGARFYRNNARPGIVLKHPGRLSPDAGQWLKESWNSQYAGAENAHKTAVLEEGIDLISVGMTAEQAQFLETRKFQRNEIAAIFGVPPHKIGQTWATSSAPPSPRRPGSRSSTCQG